VVTIGTIHGGERYNIIAGEVLLDGTVRTIQPSDTAQMPALIERTACNAAAAYGASAQVDYQRGHPAVVNAPAVAKVCRQAITETLGDTGLAADFPISPAGEDFSYFAREVPGTMAWLGCRPVNVAADVQPPLHNACFLPDPLALPVGVAYFARSVTLLLAALAA
jgi:amidohydrolase